MGKNFKFKKLNTSYIIKKYLGNDEDLKIPKEHKDLNITEIGIYAFKGNSTIKKVHIPNSIKVIGEGAFFQCSELEEVIFEIDSTIQVIEHGVFAHCNRLKSINLPSSIHRIGDSSFKNTSISSILFPKSLEVIDREAFMDTKLMQVSIPKGVKHIGDGTFRNCSNLNKAILPNSLKKINAFVFEKCTSLAIINIPKNIEFIDYRAFFGNYDCVFYFEDIQKVKVHPEWYHINKVPDIRQGLYAYQKVGKKAELYQTFTYQHKFITLKDRLHWDEDFDLVDQTVIRYTSFNRIVINFKYAEYYKYDLSVLFKHFIFPIYKKNKSEKSRMNLDVMGYNLKDELVTVNSENGIFSTWKRDGEGDYVEALLYPYNANLYQTKYGNYLVKNFDNQTKELASNEVSKNIRSIHTVRDIDLLCSSRNSKMVLDGEITDEDSGDGWIRIEYTDLHKKYINGLNEMKTKINRKTSFNENVVFVAHIGENSYEKSMIIKRERYINDYYIKQAIEKCQNFNKEKYLQLLEINFVSIDSNTGTLYCDIKNSSLIPQISSIIKNDWVKIS